MRLEEEKASHLLEKYDVRRPPVPVEVIASGEGAIIARNHFDGTESGFVLRDQGTIVIGVNTRTSRKRQRFTVAHEIGHLVLHEGKPLIVDHSLRIDRRDDVSSIGSDAQEISANAFAAALLMPQPFIVRYVSEYVAKVTSAGSILARESLIADLAREFDVSAEAMGYRLINLGILAA